MERPSLCARWNAAAWVITRRRCSFCGRARLWATRGPWCGGSSSSRLSSCASRAVGAGQGLQERRAAARQGRAERHCLLRARTHVLPCSQECHRRLPFSRPCWAIRQVGPLALALCALITSPPAMVGLSWSVDASVLPTPRLTHAAPRIHREVVGLRLSPAVRDEIFRALAVLPRAQSCLQSGQVVCTAGTSPFADSRPQPSARPRATPTRWP